ncbi:hypothetical protein [Sphingobium sp. YC-XJ3]|nr:hypothetical protein [Sphingobium sp. YC-XJ3]WDA37839.1 hypothetical protein PO876_06570 [Sphingobium sp. YC-XJ3]
MTRFTSALLNGRDSITLTRLEAVTIFLVLVALPLWIVAGGL